MNSVRYHKIDGIRGITLLSMILYHACWDIVFLAGVNLPGYRGLAGFIWQRSICCGFIIISGFCAGLSKGLFRRGIQVFAAGMLITAVTCITMYDERVVFGILTFLGSAMIIMGLIKPLMCKMPGIAGIAVSGLLFYVFYPVNRGYIIFGGHKINLPQMLYRSYFTSFIGFKSGDFFSSDYFSLMPWFFLFCAGFFLWKTAAEKGWLYRLEEGLLPIPEWLGRHSLMLYLLHQPVLYLLLEVFLYVRK